MIWNTIGRTILAIIALAGALAWGHLFSIGELQHAWGSLAISMIAAGFYYLLKDLRGQR